MAIHKTGRPSATYRIDVQIIHNTENVTIRAVKQISTDERSILETPVSWTGVASLVGGCYEDGKSFIPVSEVRCESFSHASQTELCYMGRYSALPQV